MIFVIEGCDFMNRAILIVDDAEMNRDILRMFFEEQYTIYEAADGDIAFIRKILHLLSKGFGRNCKEINVFIIYLMVV